VQSRLIRFLPPAIPLAAAATMWWPLTRNFFFADDFLHLFDLLTLPRRRFLTQVFGGHLYVVRNAIFLLMYHWFGPDPRPWFCSVLLTHLLNVVLLYVVIRHATGDRMLACFGATLWGTCPILEGALGWYAVYGQVLLTALLLSVLLSLARVVGGEHRLSVRRSLGWALLLTIGAGCFGTGIVLAAAMPAVVVAVLPRRSWTSGAVGVLVLTAVLVLATYAGLRAHAAQLEPNLDAVAPDVLSLRSTLTAIPAALGFTLHLLAFGTATLVLGSGESTIPYPGPAALAIAGCVLAGMLAGTVGASPPARRQLAMLVLLALASYAAVALGRASFFGVFRYPLGRAATSARYHYLPLMLVAAAVCLALAPLRAWRAGAARAVDGAAAAFVLARLALLVLRPLAIDHHDAQRHAVQAVLERVHAAALAAPPGSVVRLENQPFPPALIPWLFPGSAGVFLIFEPADTIAGRRVRFVVGESDWRLAHERGGRIAALVERQGSK
jgi:hypothetical protein